MSFAKKVTAAILASGIMISGISVNSKTQQSEAASAIVISPLNKYEINDGVFEGWGTSLCWWANRLGYSDELAQQSADLFFGDDGLRMNIARFNIGGGDDPSHKHITRTDSNMPGYTVFNNGNVTYDWNADANQRNVLQRVTAAAGDDIIVEMFSNSPPYYMTNSGCSSGAVDAGKNNLRDDCYDDFAEYLAEVSYHYKNDWGIDIQSITAMNEPYTNFWGANSYKQEGCHFDQGNSQSTIITELQKSMEARGMGDVIISGTDETSIDTQIGSYNALSPEAKNAVGRLDTHTYSGGRRSELKETAIAAGKNLWMSEVDGGATAGTNAGEMGAALWLAERITIDCNNLNCSAWILWQAIDNHISAVGYNGNKDKGMVDTNGGYWGLAVADHDNNNIILTKKYYAFGQYSRYIRPGMTMLKSSDNTMAAYDKEKEQLVIVAFNTSGNNADYSFDLSSFASVGTYAQAIRTSNTENWKDIGNTTITDSSFKASLPANSITTFVIDGVKGSTALENKITLNKDMLSGTDSWKNTESTNYEKVFDGNASTYFDGLGGGWVQADLGGIYDISAIGYCPRNGYEYRMTDGMFQFSEDGVNWTTAYTVPNKPSYGMNYITRFTGGSTARYVRYKVPDGSPSNEYNKDNVYCCNIAEIEIYGVPAIKDSLNRIIPESVSGSNSYKDSPNSYDKAFDGDINTYFDGVGNGWVEMDLGNLYDISAIGYCPRKNYEYRMTDGMFMVSTDGKNWSKVYTITGKPEFCMKYISELQGNTMARYVRYQVPEGKPSNSYNDDDVYCCNIAEIEVYGELINVMGDLNSDGKFSMDDVVLMQKYLLGTEYFTKQQFIIADLNNDDFVDVFDMVLFRKLLIETI